MTTPTSKDYLEAWRSDMAERQRLEDRIKELEARVPIREALLNMRVKALKAEVAEQARLLDMSASREAKLLVEVARLRRGIDNLKVRSYELGQIELHDTALALLGGGE